MPVDPSKTHYYRRARFTTRLPTEYLFAPSHFWLQEIQPGRFRIGLTHFATRMLGDFVECEFHKTLGEKIGLGDPIGWIEGFKAISDVYNVIDGTFIEFNSELPSHPQYLDRDPYDAGWLYIAEGTPDPLVSDYLGYVNRLDIAIDRILSQESEQKSC